MENKTKTIEVQKRKPGRPPKINNTYMNQNQWFDKYPKLLNIPENKYCMIEFVHVNPNIFKNINTFISNCNSLDLMFVFDIKSVSIFIINHYQNMISKILISFNSIYKYYCPKKTILTIKYTNRINDIFKSINKHTALLKMEIDQSGSISITLCESNEHNISSGIQYTIVDQDKYEELMNNTISTINKKLYKLDFQISSKDLKKMFTPSDFKNKNQIIIEYSESVFKFKFSPNDQISLTKETSFNKNRINKYNITNDEIFSITVPASLLKPFINNTLGNLVFYFNDNFEIVIIIDSMDSYKSINDNKSINDSLYTITNILDLRSIKIK